MFLQVLVHHLVMLQVCSSAQGRIRRPATDLHQQESKEEEDCKVASMNIDITDFKTLEKLRCEQCVRTQGYKLLFV